MVTRPKCANCNCVMERLESRVREADDERPKSQLTRKPVGWICFSPGCDGIKRTWFEIPITPP